MFKVDDKVKVLGKSKEYEEIRGYTFGTTANNLINSVGVIKSIANGPAGIPSFAYIIKFLNTDAIYTFYEKELQLIEDDWDV